MFTCRRTSRNSSNTEALTCRYLSSEILGVLNMACKICEQLRNTRIQIYVYRTILCLCAAACSEIRVFSVPVAASRDEFGLR